MSDHGMGETPGPATRTPPTGIARWFFRAPIVLYRWRMGWLLGKRFVLLHHVGRTSGLPRQAVVEVVRRDADSVIICSGFGEKSQWYRNVIAHPDISITLGRLTYPVRAVRLDADDAVAEMLDYARRHPKSAARLAGYMGFDADGGPQTYCRVGQVLPFPRLQTRTTTAPQTGNGMG